MGNLNQYLTWTPPPLPPQNQGGGRNVVNIVFGGAASPPQAEDTLVHIISQAESHNYISSTDADYEGLNPNHNEALVVSLLIADNEVKRILVDDGSSVDI